MAGNSHNNFLYIATACANKLELQVSLHTAKKKPHRNPLISFKNISFLFKLEIQ